MAKLQIVIDATAGDQSGLASSKQGLAQIDAAAAQAGASMKDFGVSVDDAITKLLRTEAATQVMNDAKASVAGMSEEEKVARLAAADLADAQDKAAEASKKHADDEKGLSLALTGVNQGLEIVGKAVEAVQKVWDFAKEGAAINRIDEQWTATAKDFGAGSDTMIASLDRVTGGTVKDEELMSATARDMTQGFFKNSQQIVDSFAIAQAMTVRFGGTVIENQDAINMAVETGMSRSLKAKGIIVDFTAAYADYAKKIGVSVTSLDDETKAQIRLNTVLDQGKVLVGKVGDATNDALSHMQHLEVEIDKFADRMKSQVSTSVDVILFGEQQLHTEMAAHADEVAHSAENYKDYSTEIARSGQITKDLTEVTGEYRKSLVMADIENGTAAGRFVVLNDHIYEINNNLNVLTEAEFNARGATAALDHNLAVITKAGLDWLNVLTGANKETTAAAPPLNEYAAAALASSRAAYEDAQANEVLREHTAEVNAATLAASESLYGLSQSAMNFKKPSDIAKEALSGLQQMADAGKLSGDSFSYAWQTAGEATGLVSKESVATARAIDLLNGAYAAGKVSPEEYSKALGLIPQAAKDGIVTLGELGIKSETTAHKSKQDVMDAMGNVASETMSGVGKSVDAGMRSITNATTATKGVVATVGAAVDELPTRHNIDIFINVHGSVPDVSGSSNPSAGSRALGGPVMEGLYYLHDNEYVLSEAMRLGMQPIPSEALPTSALRGTKTTVNNNNFYDGMATRLYLERQRLDDIASVAEAM